MLRRTRLLLLCLFLALLVVVDLIRLEDLDLQVLQDRNDVIEFLLVFDRLGERLVDVVPRQVALLLGLADELADALVDAARGALGGSARGRRVLRDDGLNGFGLGICGSSGLGFARHGSFGEKITPHPAAQGADGAGVEDQSVLLRVKKGQPYCPSGG